MIVLLPVAPPMVVPLPVAPLLMLSSALIPRLALIVRLRNFLLVVILDGKAHNIGIRRSKPLQKIVLLREYLQPKFGVIL